MSNNTYDTFSILNNPTITPLIVQKPLINSINTYDLATVIMDSPDKLNSIIDFMKKDELADPNMTMDLTLCLDMTYLTLVATASSKPLSIEINYIKIIMHIEVNYIPIE